MKIKLVLSCILFFCLTFAKPLSNTNLSYRVSDFKSKLYISKSLLLNKIQTVDTNSFQPIIDTFFSIYESQNTNKALDYIFSTNSWLNNNQQDKIVILKTNLINTIKVIGKYYGKESITQKSIGSNFILCSFLIKYERQPIRFTFIFYKPSNNWTLLNFKFDDNISKELEEAAVIYRLYENLPKK